MGDPIRSGDVDVVFTRDKRRIVWDSDQVKRLVPNFLENNVEWHTGLDVDHHDVAGQLNGLATHDLVCGDTDETVRVTVTGEELDEMSSMENPGAVDEIDDPR